jgi:hypothetical protein
MGINFQSEPVPNIESLIISELPGLLKRKLDTSARGFGSALRT